MKAYAFTVQLKQTMRDEWVVHEYMELILYWMNGYDESQLVKVLIPLLVMEAR